jgi:hypothetical protein
MRCLIGFFLADRRSRPGGRRRRRGSALWRRGARSVTPPEQVTLHPDPGRRYLRFVAGMKGLDGRSARRAVETVIASCGLRRVAETSDREAVEGLPAARRRGPGVAWRSARPRARRADRRPRSQTWRCGPAARSRRPGLSCSTHVLAEASAPAPASWDHVGGQPRRRGHAAGGLGGLEGAERVVVRGTPAGGGRAGAASLPGALGVDAAARDGEAGHRFVVRAKEAEPGSVPSRRWSSDAAGRCSRCTP